MKTSKQLDAQSNSLSVNLMLMPLLVIVSEDNTEDRNKNQDIPNV